MDESLYAIALGRLKGISLTVAMQLYQLYGSAAAVYEHRYEAEGKLRDALADWTPALKRAEAELEFCSKNRIRILTLNDEDYPARLRECPDAPLTIFYKGQAELNNFHTISVVGTRQISIYGKEICQSFCSELTQLLPGCLIVSGLAYGVDIHIHRACLHHFLPTVGVLAHGLDRINPTLHRNTAISMLEQGGLLTEYLSGTNPDKGNFVRRNRIIAGLSDVTVVVESAAKGGALITASLANDYNREVAAFPGRVGDQYSEGCNAYIRDNKARLITSAKDLIQAMNWQATPPQAATVQGELFPVLSPVQLLICEKLQGSDGVSLNKLVLETGLPVHELTGLLTQLELEGIVKMVGGSRYKVLR